MERGSAKGFGAGLAAVRWAMMKKRATGRKLRRRIFVIYDFMYQCGTRSELARIRWGSVAVSINFEGDVGKRKNSNPWWRYSG